MHPIAYKTSVALKVILLTLFVVVTNLRANLFFRIEELIYNFGNYLGAAVFLLLWAICLLAIYSAAFTENGYLRLCLAMILAISSAVGFGYEYIAETQLGHDGIALLWEARSHADDAISFYQGKLLVVSIVTLLGFLSIVILPRRPEIDVDNSKERPSLYRRLISAKMACVLTVIPVLMIFSIAVLRSGRGMPGLPVQYKAPSLFILVLSEQALSRGHAREDISIEQVRKDTVRHVVLIVDESVRGDYLDINLDRNITPKLSSNAHRLVNFGFATSAANCSTATNLVLRTGANPTNFQESLRNNPYLWSYAKRAGYRTVFIEAQEKEGTLANQMTLDEVAGIDEFIYATGTTGRDRDMDAARIVRRMLTDDRPSFIYVIKSGAHFPYEGAYDLNEAIHRPHMESTHIVALTESTTREHKQLMINSYKNAIQLSVDRFLDRIISDVPVDDAVVIYTSDHGQNLMDGSTTRTHCSEEGATAYEALVPLIVLTDVPEWRKLLEVGAARNFNKSSHFNIFPTILQIFGYDEVKIREKHGRTLLLDLDQTARFVSGHVTPNYRLALGDHHAVRWNEGIQGLLNSGELKSHSTP